MASAKEKIEDLTTFSGRLRAALKDAGKRQRDLSAHFGITEQAVSQWVRGGSPDRDKLFQLERLLGVRAEWLLHGTLPRNVPSDTLPQVENPIEQSTIGEINIQQWARDVPILGGASCGEDGLFELNGQTLDHAKRPPRLVGVNGIYALYVHGESMSPWREPGQLVYVHPHQPVTIGDYVVVQMQPEKPGDLPAAYIKRLVRRTADKLVLFQWNPREEKVLSIRKVKSIQRIMDWSELLSI